MMEPSFFFGAMYVNYAISLTLVIGVFIISKLIFELNLLNCFISIMIISLLLTPITLRLSRIIWINIFVNYKEEKKSKTQTV